MNDQDFTVGDRWIAHDRKVWERREWGWKFLGLSESYQPSSIMGLRSTDCDHPLDVMIEDEGE